MKIKQLFQGLILRSKSARNQFFIIGEVDKDTVDIHRIYQYGVSKVVINFQKFCDDFEQAENLTYSEVIYLLQTGVIHHVYNDRLKLHNECIFYFNKELFIQGPDWQSKYDPVPQEDLLASWNIIYNINQYFNVVDSVVDLIEKSKQLSNKIYNFYQEVKQRYHQLGYNVEMSVLQHDSFSKAIPQFTIIKRTLKDQIEMRIDIAKKMFLSKSTIPYQDIKSFINNKCAEIYSNFVYKLIDNGFKITFTTLPHPGIYSRSLLSEKDLINGLLSTGKKEITLLGFVHDANIIESPELGIATQIMPFIRMGIL